MVATADPVDLCPILISQEQLTYAVPGCDVLK
jgi:hypothetical protein